MVDVTPVTVSGISATPVVPANPTGIALQDLSNVSTASFLAKIASTQKIYTFAPEDPTDCADDLQTFVETVIANAAVGLFPPGTYTLGSNISALVNNSCEFIAADGAKFVASASFPSARMFYFHDGSGSGFTFKWEGGDFDGSNIPLPGVGEATDVFSLDTDTVSIAKIVLDRVYTGDDWLSAGGDSHVFAGGGVSQLEVGIRRSIGAADSAVYLSGNADGTAGDSALVWGNYDKAIDAVAIKRKFKNTRVEINTEDCQNGAGVAGFDPLPGGYVCNISVNALRTERPVTMIAGAGAHVTVVARELGVSIPGYTSTTGYALYLSGFSACSGFVTVDGINADCTLSSNFKALHAERRTLGTTDYDSTDNAILINCRNIGKAFSEDSHCSANLFTVRETNSSVASVCATATSAYMKLDPANSRLIFGNSQDLLLVSDGALQLGGGTADGYSLRVEHIATTANQWTMGGAAAGGHPFLQVFGSNTDIDMQLYPKGAGLLDYRKAASSASVASNFSAAKYLTLKANGTTVYVPCSTSAW